MAASRNGHVEVVDKLLQHGATVDLQKEVQTLYVNTQWKQKRLQNVILEQWTFKFYVKNGFKKFLVNSLLFYVLGWVESADFGILQRTCQSCG